MLAVFLLALVARGFYLVRDGLEGTGAYDQSVYYTAAVAVSHGRVPYRGDFTFIHPPTIVLVGQPFAWLGRVTTDRLGFLVENWAFVFVGALTAAFLVVAARSWGASRGAALTGGALYAVWIVPVLADSSARLEPLGNLLLAISLWLLADVAKASPSRLVLAGVVLALMVNVKAWWLPCAVLLMLATGLVAGRVRALAPTWLAFVGTCLVLDLPLMLLSHGRMFDAIVGSQLNRSYAQWTPGGRFEHIGVWDRLQGLSGLSHVIGSFPVPAATFGSVAAQLWAALACVAIGAAAVRAWQHPAGRVVVPLLGVQVAALLVAHMFYEYYGDYLAVTVALVVSFALSAGPVRLPFTRLAAGAFALGAILTYPLWLLAGSPSSHDNLDRPALVAATSHVGCIVAETPITLIKLDALNRSFEKGCRNVVDFQGISQGGGPDPRATASRLQSTPAYRRFVADYLSSGDAVALQDYYVRVRLGPRVVGRLDQGRPIVRSGPLVVRMTSPR